MDAVNQTLYIPLYGKALVSEKGIILRDPKAQEIWAAEGFPLKGKSKSKWLAYYMGIRSAVFDRWTQTQMEADPTAVVLHLGCGLDSRCHRVGTQGHLWFDVDFSAVMAERKRHYQETEAYHMIAADVTAAGWLDAVPGGTAIVILEGVSMYLSPDALKGTLEGLYKHFDRVHLLMDCYTTFAAKASKYRNPINDVGVTQVYGMDDPTCLEGFYREHHMTPADLIDQLQGLERKIFKTLYAGGVAKKMYRLYEYRR